MAMLAQAEAMGAQRRLAHAESAAQAAQVRALYEAIPGRDYVVIQGFTLAIAVIYVIVNLLVDLSYGFLDPRIRQA